MIGTVVLVVVEVGEVKAVLKVYVVCAGQGRLHPMMAYVLRVIYNEL